MRKLYIDISNEVFERITGEHEGSIDWVNDYAEILGMSLRRSTTPSGHRLLTIADVGSQMTKGYEVCFGSHKLRGSYIGEARVIMNEWGFNDYLGLGYLGKASGDFRESYLRMAAIRRKEIGSGPFLPAYVGGEYSYIHPRWAETQKGTREIMSLALGIRQDSPLDSITTGLWNIAESRLAIHMSQSQSKYVPKKWYLKITDLGDVLVPHLSKMGEFAAFCKLKNLDRTHPGLYYRAMIDIICQALGLEHGTPDGIIHDFLIDHGHGGLSENLINVKQYPMQYYN